jgi:DivIVA domain-containing protein
MALAIEILFAVLVLLAAGLAAAGRIDGMSRAVPDAPPGLPEGEVTPEGLRDVTLPVVLRGYRMSDVDEVLERAAAELESARAAAGLRPTARVAAKPSPMPSTMPSTVPSAPSGPSPTPAPRPKPRPSLEKSDSLDGEPDDVIDG